MSNEYFLLSGLFLVIFTFAILLYFRLAEHYHIIDKPNSRSSHQIPTIRGGGIVFVVALLGFVVLFGLQFKYFLLGFFSLALISFLDDIKEMKKRLRLGIQLLASILLIFQISQGAISWWEWLIYLVIVLATINAYNFMDGINGITGFYSLVFFVTVLFEIANGSLDMPLMLIVLPILAILIFLFFNARMKARCFAGDVGSVSLAFLIIFILGTICWQQQTFMYFWLLGIYGVDSFSTIVQRLYLRQNILQGHRMHLYQVMANEAKIPHVLVSVLFAIAQLTLNVILILYIIPQGWNSVILSLVIAISLLIIYIPLKYFFLKSEDSQKKNRSALAGLK
jgi:UDP-GlcNAc:undecaprenyl-phosphate/decaprenyl-phosphate GlcNAc-1-phosphate transferase